uniref:Uncharacterized protein n=1 Tax=Brassica campestris TaxID=3711 RepID=A0A3P6A1Z8_BRACM|nr:unnamed protein product [Brassica rapa]
MDLPICAACNFTNNGPCTLGSGNSCVMAPYFSSTEPGKFDLFIKFLESKMFTRF